MPKLLKEYRSQLKQIKGLFNVDIPLNKKLTKNDKAQITRLFNIYNKDKLNLGRFSDISDFVDININPRKKLTKSQKAKIRRYHKQFSDLTDSKSYQVYKNKNDKKLKAVQSYAHGKTLPGFKVAFVPRHGSSKKLGITVDKNGIVKVKSKFMDSYYIEFNKNKLINNPQKYIKGLIKKNPGDSYNIRVGGDRTIAEPVNKISAAIKIMNLMERYAQTYKEWLNGLDVNTFKNQKEKKKYHNDDIETRKKFKRDKSRIKQAAYRARIKANK